MSAKTKTTKNSKGMKIAVAVVALLLIASVLYLLLTRVGTASDIPNDAVLQASDKNTAEDNVILDRRLRVERIGSYSGLYVEDGTDETVTDILMMEVTNVSEENIQYAEIELPVGEETAMFSLSTLPAGATVILLEQNRMPYSDSEDYRNSAAECTLLAVHQEALNLHEDKLQIQLLEGAVNITNISGNDIEDTIVLYYKNISGDQYYGGITYRIKLEGGLKAGELKQMMVSHMHQPGSRMMFAEFVS